MVHGIHTLPEWVQTSDDDCDPRIVFLQNSLSASLLPLVSRQSRGKHVGIESTADRGLTL